VKGGSDTTTALMDGQSVRIPRSYINNETVAVTRLTMLLLVLCHRLYQIFTTDVQQHTTVRKYRNAANQRVSFENSIKKIRVEFKSRLEEVLAGVARRSSIQITRRPPPRRIRQRVHGIVPTHIDFNPQLTNDTPLKVTRQVNSGVASDEVTRMVKECTGMPVKLADANSHQRCDVCAAKPRAKGDKTSVPKTSWFCIGCKRYLCMERRMDSAKVQNDPEFSLYQRTFIKRKRNNEVVVKRRNFQRLCFHNAHEQAWCRLTEDNEEDEE
jgi:hypothetical protein